MAATSTVALSAIRRSPSTVQYGLLDARPPKFYKPRFTLSTEDRAKTLLAPWFCKRDPMMPAYPFGPDRRYPEANDGLYGGSSIRSGHKISKGRNKGKTLRKWYPNVKVERLRSEALNRELTLPVATRVMRTIRKAGGLDEYVVGTKPARIKELGMLGWKLRWMVLNSKKFREMYDQARAGEEEPNMLDETFEQVWSDPARREALVEKQSLMWGELREKDERFKRHQQKNILADKGALRVPDLATLSFYDPESLKLAETEVVQAPPRKKVAKHKQRRRVDRTSSVV